MRDEEQLADGNFELSVQVYKLVTPDNPIEPPEQVMIYGTTVSLSDDLAGNDIHTSLRRLAYDADRAIHTFKQKHCEHNYEFLEGLCSNCGKSEHEIGADDY